MCSACVVCSVCGWRCLVCGMCVCSCVCMYDVRVGCGVSCSITLYLSPLSQGLR